MTPRYAPLGFAWVHLQADAHPGEPVIIGGRLFRVYVVLTREALALVKAIYSNGGGSAKG